MDLNEKWSEHIESDHYAHPVSWLEDELGYELLDSEIVGESRWGTFYEAFYKSPEGDLVGVSYEDAAAEGEYDAEQRGAEFYPVEAREVTVTKYVRI